MVHGPFKTAFVIGFGSTALKFMAVLFTVGYSYILYIVIYICIFQYSRVSLLAKDVFSHIALFSFGRLPKDSAVGFPPAEAGSAMRNQRGNEVAFQ